MAEIVNLNRFRKARNKAEAEAKASNNRLLFGRKRVEKEVDRKNEDKRDKDLDGKKITD